MSKDDATREWEKFRAATRKVLSVSKEELAKREATWRRKHDSKQKGQGHSP